MNELLLALIAGLAFGLWIGERGRRHDMESILEQAIGWTRKVDPVPPAADAVELRQDYAHVVDFQVEQVADHILQEAQAMGKEVTLDQARDEARKMLLELEPDRSEP